MLGLFWGCCNVHTSQYYLFYFLQGRIYTCRYREAFFFYHSKELYAIYILKSENEVINTATYTTKHKVIEASLKVTNLLLVTKLSSRIWGIFRHNIGYSWMKILQELLWPFEILHWYAVSNGNPQSLLQEKE